ncbi:MAG: magnesium chelatase subunit H [Pseudomonadota bacterium]
MDGKAIRVKACPVRVVMVTLDAHLASAVRDAERALARQIPGLSITFFAASDWDRQPDSLEACKAAIAQADIILASMLFLEDHICAIRPALLARRPHCDAMVCTMSASEIVKLTRLGRFDMDKPETGPIALLKRLRGSGKASRSGANQMRMLRRLPKLLKYIPGTAQDVRAYFLSMQYWLAGSEENIAGLVSFLVDRYAAGPRRHFAGTLRVNPPTDYPEIGVYHPRMTPTIAQTAAKLPLARSKKPAVGLLLMRSYLLGGDTQHYDGVIAALEAQGLRVIPVFASGLDARPAIEKFFLKEGIPLIDGMISLTGFSLVGGPAYNDSAAAADTLQALDVPYLAAHALEFQSLSEWGAGTRGLSPVEATMMVAIPELDGATNPTVFGGRGGPEKCTGCGQRCSFAPRDHGRMVSCPDRAGMLAARMATLLRLRQRSRAERKIAITLFNFPPNGGGVGTAAHLAVFESLLNTLNRLQAEGYTVDCPADIDALKAAILEGNADQHGADANVAATVPRDTHVTRETRLNEIEAQWGPAPGRHQTDGRNLQVFGAQFGNIFVGVQPAFGYEGDPMRLLFEGSFAPTHAFANYYRWMREDFGADALIHFGTHGALEFMPGKQSGMSGQCWSDHLIGDLPHIYFYAANNPSEATIAKRRAAATVVSYLTPAVTEAGLYKELIDLKETIDRWRQTPTDEEEKRTALAAAITQLAAALHFSDMTEDNAAAETLLTPAAIEALRLEVNATEDALIPHGLHVAGRKPEIAEQVDLLKTLATTQTEIADAAEGTLPDDAIMALARGEEVSTIAKRHGLRAHTDLLTKLATAREAMTGDSELDGLIHALDGGFIAPVAGGDLIRNPEILPAGRNIHGFDPFRLPSAFAVIDGRNQADRLIERHRADMGAAESGAESVPETVAMVLWGTDNLKSEGAQIAQALALIGATPRFDSYGRLSGADLIPLEALSRPRIDVVVTLSGIFRDLLPLQTRMLAEACFAAASADEPAAMNYVRTHALAYQLAHGCDLETAALRVFSNADGAYGSNVNHLIDAGCWDEESDLADAYERRKCFAYGISGKPVQHAALLTSILKDVDLAYQNLESVELGVTTIDHYFDTLGGVGRAVKRAKGTEAPVYIGDQTRGDGVVRSLTEQVALETRTRTLNPKWYEGMLKHGYEGVRQIEAHVTNTMGWSATTGQVDPWVYQKITETFVLDKDLHERLATLNPKSCAKVANRLLEASDRKYWSPDAETLAALHRAGEDLEDRIEGIYPADAPQGALA